MRDCPPTLRSPREASVEPFENLAMKLRRERFTLADLMIVVVASAISAALLRATFASSGGGYLRHVPAPSSHWDRAPLGTKIGSLFFHFLYNGVPQILVACLCIIALFLRGRRAAFSRLSHHPGLMLSLAAVIASAWSVLMKIPAVRSDFSGLAPWRLVVNHILPNAGFMVVGSWMTLIVIGRGRPAPSWIDRTGYALAALLGLLLVLDQIRLLLENARLM